MTDLERSLQERLRESQAHLTRTRAARDLNMDLYMRAKNRIAILEEAVEALKIYHKSGPCFCHQPIPGVHAGSCYKAQAVFRRSPETAGIL